MLNDPLIIGQVVDGRSVYNIGPTLLVQDKPMGPEKNPLPPKFEGRLRTLTVAFWTKPHISVDEAFAHTQKPELQ